MKILRSIWQEIRGMLPEKRRFLFFSMLIGFCIGGEYAITRPASTSIFLSFYTASYLPYVWLATVPLNFLAVFFYNRFLPRIGPVVMLAIMATSVVSMHLACVFLLPHLPWLIFLQFVWKDIYILFMFKQLWSLIHASIEQQSAKYLYGLIYGMGTVGSILCSLIPGFFAIEVGSNQLFLCTLPLYGVLFWAYTKAFQQSPLTVEALKNELRPQQRRPEKSFSVFRQSPFILFLFLLVIFMQVSVGLTEYQFNSYLETEILDQDARTAYCGRITTIVNLLSSFLQGIGCFFLVHTLGLRGNHLLIPCVLLLNALAFAAFPSFAMISLVFVFLKAIDFSLFGVVREMLYIPLSTDEKFRAKALIDVFTYRTSKALASGLILTLQIVAGAFLLPTIRYVALAVFLGWLAVAIRFFKQHQEPSYN